MYHLETTSHFTDNLARDREAFIRHFYPAIKLTKYQNLGAYSGEKLAVYFDKFALIHRRPPYLFLSKYENMLGD